MLCSREQAFGNLASLQWSLQDLPRKRDLGLCSLHLCFLPWELQARKNTHPSWLCLFCLPFLPQPQKQMPDTFSTFQDWVPPRYSISPRALPPFPTCPWQFFNFHSSAWLGLSHLMNSHHMTTLAGCRFLHLEMLQFITYSYSKIQTIVSYYIMTNCSFVDSQ